MTPPRVGFPHPQLESLAFFKRKPSRDKDIVTLCYAKLAAVGLECKRLEFQGPRYLKSDST